MNNTHFYRIFRTLSILGFIFLITNNSVSQSLSFTGTAPTLTLNAGTPGTGGTLTSKSDQTVRLNYTTPRLPNPATYRITVGTNLTSPLFTLTVEAISPTRGTAQGVVILNSSTGTNFITAIPRNQTTTRFCYLKYTASADFSDGIGTDTHSVTYTLLQP